MRPRILAIARPESILQLTLIALVKNLGKMTKAKKLVKVVYGNQKAKSVRMLAVTMHNVAFRITSDKLNFELRRSGRGEELQYGLYRKRKRT
jgi:hypothetical protein